MDPILYESPALAPNGEPFMRMRKNNKGFYYAERVGVDSVAFVLKDGANYGLLRCRQGATGVVANRAFTGSMDMENPSPIEALKTEAREEAGYDIDFQDTEFYGIYEVGHMTNEEVLLFLVNVTGKTPHEVEWKGLEKYDLLGTVWNQSSIDWKAILIMNGDKGGV